MNIQPPEKAIRVDTGVLSVHSIFYTMQGEGPFSGVPAVFVRLAGCNLQCPQCDTDYTSGRRKMEPIQILREVEQLLPSKPRAGSCPLVVITGGEPFRQKLESLVSHLLWQGYAIQIETNGVLAPSFDVVGRVQTCVTNGRRENFVYIVISPKTGGVNGRTAAVATAWKYVGDHTNLSEQDGLPTRALEHPNAPYLARPIGPGKNNIYLQPTDFSMLEDKKDPFSILDVQSRNQLAQEACVKSCLAFGHRLQLQIHKIVRVP